MKKSQKFGFWFLLAAVCVLLTVLGWQQTMDHDDPVSPSVTFSSPELLGEHVGPSLLLFDPQGFGFDPEQTQLTLNYTSGFDPNDPAGWVNCIQSYQNDLGCSVSVNTYFEEDFRWASIGYPPYTDGAQTVQLEAGITAQTADVVKTGAVPYRRLWFSLDGSSYMVTFYDPAGADAWDQYQARLFSSRT